MKCKSLNVIRVMMVIIMNPDLCCWLLVSGYRHNV